MTLVHSVAMRLDPSEGIQSGMAQGTYEPEQTGWARECLQPGDRFVDLGANFGWYTALAAGRVGPTGQVFAFEPSPLASGVIATAIRENGLRQVTLVCSAVGDSVGEVQLKLPPDDSVHSPSVLDCGPTYTPITVPVTSLDAYQPLADHHPIKLIKIDVEGYEPNAIAGMAGLLRRGLVENIICELNAGWLAVNGATPASLQRQIESYGYEAFRQTDIQAGGGFTCHDVWFRHKRVGQQTKD